MKYRNPVCRKIDRRDKKIRNKKRITDGLILLVIVIITLIVLNK